MAPVYAHACVAGLEVGFLSVFWQHLTCLVPDPLCWVLQRWYNSGNRNCTCLEGSTALPWPLFPLSHRLPHYLPPRHIHLGLFNLSLLPPGRAHPLQQRPISTSLGLRPAAAEQNHLGAIWGGRAGGRRRRRAGLSLPSPFPLLCVPAGGGRAVPLSQVNEGDGLSLRCLGSRVGWSEVAAGAGLGLSLLRHPGPVITCARPPLCPLLRMGWWEHPEMQGPSHLHPALPGTWPCWFFHSLAWPLAFWARFILPWFLQELPNAATASTVTQGLQLARVFLSLVDRDVAMVKPAPCDAGSAPFLLLWAVGLEKPQVMT